MEPMMLGHNGGPTLERGTSWRKHCWSKARRDLLPTMPLEIVRQRVRRAEALGLDYRTYASVRASAGCDIVAFLFSSNALGLRRSAADLDDARATRLGKTQACDFVLSAHRPLDPAEVTRSLQIGRGIEFRAAKVAPLFSDSWSSMRDRIRETVGASGLAPSGVVLVGVTAFEREWCAAGKLGYYLEADRFFS
jgi:hypothetical protein